MIKNIKTAKKEKKKARKWLWDGMIREGSINILVGQQSRGKSMLATGLIKEMLKSRGGQTYLGRGVHPAKILYVSTEMAEDSIVERLADIGVDGRMKNVNKRFFIYYNPLPRLSDIENAISECDPDFIIIDILGGLIAGEGFDMNSYDDINSLIPKLKAFNKAILLIHHMNKKNQAMGSTATLSAMDTRFEMLETDRDLDENNNVIIYQTIHTYGKGVQDQYINVRFTYPEFHLAEAEQVEELDKPLAKLMQQVIQTTTSGEKMEGTFQEIAAKCQLLEKYQFNPKRLGALLRMNEETLRRNFIFFETTRKNKGYILKIWFDPLAGSDEEPEDEFSPYEVEELTFDDM